MGAEERVPGTQMLLLGAQMFIFFHVTSFASFYHSSSCLLLTAFIVTFLQFPPPPTFTRTILHWLQPLF